MRSSFGHSSARMPTTMPLRIVAYTVCWQHPPSTSPMGTSALAALDSASTFMKRSDELGLNAGSNTSTVSEWRKVAIGRNFLLEGMPTPFALRDGQGEDTSLHRDRFRIIACSTCRSRASSAGYQRARVSPRVEDPRSFRTLRWRDRLRGSSTRGEAGNSMCPLDLCAMDYD